MLSSCIIHMINLIIVIISLILIKDYVFINILSDNKITAILVVLLLFIDTRSILILNSGNLFIFIIFYINI